MDVIGKTAKTQQGIFAVQRYIQHIAWKLLIIFQLSEIIINKLMRAHTDRLSCRRLLYMRPSKWAALRVRSVRPSVRPSAYLSRMGGLLVRKQKKT